MPEGLSIRYSGGEWPRGNRTRVDIKNYGRIGAASIELAPLTVLVGKNNTGKSYIAELLWAVRSGFLGFTRRSGFRVGAPDWFRAYVNTAHASEAQPLRIDAKRVLTHYNKWLKENKNYLISNLLSLEDAKIGRVQLEAEGTLWLSPQSEPPDWFREQGFERFTVRSWGLAWENTAIMDPSQGMISMSEEDHADEIFCEALERILLQNNAYHSSNTIYIPAARTGLVLALKEIAASVLGSLGLSPSGDNDTRFSRPTIDFLRTLIRYTERREGKTTDIADFLERNIYSGKLIIEGTGTPTFIYNPSETRQRLPMHAASSMITELTPILSVLRSAHFGGGFIIEEPEAHLHLSAQRVMARAIAKLANAGIPVVLTTHSDTFVQQINLLMQIYGHEDRNEITAKLGYEDDEILSPSDVVGYEFIPSARGTTVSEAKKSSDGLIISSLNETLVELAEDVMSIGESS